MFFIRTYGEVWFKNIIISQIRLFEIDENSFMTINDLKTSLELIRCVGQTIFRIVFDTEVGITDNAIQKFQIDRKFIAYIHNH